MADLTITAANVMPGANAQTVTGIAGAALTAGKAVFLDTVTNTWKLAGSNSATVSERAANGIALNGASAGQPVEVQTGGDITIGAAVVQGVAYYTSGVAGGICPVADIVAGMQSQVVGIAKSATTLSLFFATAGVTL